MKYKRFFRRVLIILFITVLFVQAQAGILVSLVIEQNLEGPALHGVKKLEQALQAKGHTVIFNQDVVSIDADLFILAGKSTTEGPCASMLRVLNVPIPKGQEALVVQRMELQGKPALVLCGSDDVGLMYAGLDIADRISWTEYGQDPLKYVKDISENPDILERAVSIYTMQRAHFERFLYDEKQLECYFDMLAASRINSFVIIFGYENGGFMAPAYPYFFDVDEFPDVTLVGITPEQQSNNTKALQRMIQIAHLRGIRFCPAFWDHIYRGEVQGGGIPGASENAGKRLPHLVWGVTTENLAAYNKAALMKFIQVFPDIDGIQFRVHWESGLTREETPLFWHEMFTIFQQERPDLRIDLRAKGLPDVVIEDAIKLGLNFRITTKYWMEQMGLPFHPTHINKENQNDRRHSYADLLSNPKRYQVHWRLWNGGTSRFLLWADPDYVRRFAESTKVYGGNSFEINEMLATKMLGENHDAQPFDLLTPEYQYYDYEFERYWHFYQVWGRVSYNPEVSAEIWEQKFYSRFGREAGKALMDGLHLASQVLPRIVASSYLYKSFPTTRGWAEMMRQGDLPVYATAEGSDIQQFMNTEDYARSINDGVFTAMRQPTLNSQWFHDISESILANVTIAEKAGDMDQSKEFISTVTDLKILANLAEFHSRRLLAGIEYNLYTQTGDLLKYDRAIELEENAKDAWENIVFAAGNVYSRDLAFGVHEKGFSRHWSEELELLETGLEQLKTDREQIQSQSNKDKLPIVQMPVSEKSNDDKTPPSVRLERIPKAIPGSALVVHALVFDPSGVKWVRLRYRHLTQFEDYQTLDMQIDPETGLYQAIIPGDFIVPERDLMYFSEAVDSLGNGCMIPDLEKEMPYVIVETEQ